MIKRSTKQLTRQLYFWVLIATISGVFGLCVPGTWHTVKTLGRWVYYHGATFSVVPSIPVAGLALILGVARLMSEARALTNFIGNGVATVVIALGKRTKP